MRALLRLILAFAVLQAPALAADTQAGGLAPGKPSGVQQAQGFMFNYPVLFGAALAVVAVGGYYAASHNVGAVAAPVSTTP